MAKAKKLVAMGTILVCGVRRTKSVRIVWHVREDVESFLKGTTKGIRRIREKKALPIVREEHFCQEFPSGEFMQSKTAIGLAYATAIRLLQMGYEEVRVVEFGTGKVLKANFNKGDVTRTVNTLARIEASIRKYDKEEPEKVAA